MAYGTASNVSAGKPNTAGAVYYGATSLTAPASASASLASGFKAVGYVSDAGVSNSNTRTSESVKAWGGDTVLNTQTEKTDKFTFTLLEILNTDVLSVVHGSTNVSGTLSGGVTVNVNSKELDYNIWVIDMVMKGGVLHRIVLPYAKITEIADITYTDSGASGYQITLTAEPDSNGNTHYEYFKSASST